MNYVWNALKRKDGTENSVGYDSQSPKYIDRTSDLYYQKCE